MNRKLKNNESAIIFLPDNKIKMNLSAKKEMEECNVIIKALYKLIVEGKDPYFLNSLFEASCKEVGKEKFEFSNGSTGWTEPRNLLDLCLRSKIKEDE